MSRRERQYAVEILERYQHGRYPKEFYFGMYLPGFSKKDAEEVGIETLAGMTFKEINERCVNGNKMHPWQVRHQQEHEKLNGADAPIGLELAEAFFSCRAYIE